MDLGRESVVYTCIGKVERHGPRQTRGESESESKSKSSSSI